MHFYPRYSVRESHHYPGISDLSGRLLITNRRRIIVIFHLMLTIVHGGCAMGWDAGWMLLIWIAWSFPVITRRVCPASSGVGAFPVPLGGDAPQVENVVWICLATHINTAHPPPFASAGLPASASTTANLFEPISANRKPHGRQMS